MVMNNNVRHYQSQFSESLLWYLQVQVYFPVIAQPGFGLVRTVVKDDNDTDRGQESVRCAADSLLWQWWQNRQTYPQQPGPEERSYINGAQSIVAV
jgi:hypothetical protein